MSGTSGGVASPKLYRLGEALIRHRLPVGLVTLAGTVFMAYFAFQVHMSTRFDDLLPYNHPYVQLHQKYAAEFGGANNITIMIEVKNGTIFNVDTLRRIFKITEAVDALDGVNHDQIDSIGHRSTRSIKISGSMITTPPVMSREPESDADVHDIEKAVHHSGNIYGILVSFDDKAALVRANFIEGAVPYQVIFDEINDRIIKPFQDDNHTIWVAGEPRLYGWVYYYAYEAFYVFGGAGFLLWCLLWYYFRDWRGALRPTLTGLVSSMWGLGITNMIGFSIDPLSLVIPFFVTARAVSHSVQMHDRYYEEYKRADWDKHKAIIGAFAELFVPTLSGIVTDALGMLAIVLIPVVILQRIAISASIWVSTIAFSELILNPIIYHYLAAPDKENVLRREVNRLQRWIDSYSHAIVSPKGAAITIAFWLVAFGAAATQWRHITIGDPTAASPLLWADSPYNQAHTRIQNLFGGVEPFIVFVESKEEGGLRSPAVLTSMEALQRELDADRDVGYSFSIADIVKSVSSTFYDTQPRWAVIPDTLKVASNLFFYYFAGSPPSLSSKFLDPSYTNSHVTFYCRNHQGDNVARIIKKAQDFITAHPNEEADFRLAGGLVGVTAAANEEILRNDVLMNILGFGTIFVVLLLTYRSFVAGVLMLLPLMLANGIINAYMGFRNVGINLQSLPVVTVGVGFGIDYGLYIVSRAIEEYQTTKDMRLAMERGVSTTGRAVIITALSLMIATLFWTFTNTRFDAEMGLLLFLWMGISFLTSVSLMPAILVVMRPKFLYGNLAREVTQVAERPKRTARA